MAKNHITIECLSGYLSPEPNTGCWLWSGGLNPDGYGRFWANGRHWQAHRISYEMVHGPIPDGLEIDHLCRVRSCANPNHLEAVTKKENVRRGLPHRSPEVTKCSLMAAVAARAAQTHCKNGHEFTKDNTFIRPKTVNQIFPNRDCRMCHRLRQQRIRYKKCS